MNLFMVGQRIVTTLSQQQTTTLRVMTILSQQYDGDNGNNDDNI